MFDRINIKAWTVVAVLASALPAHAQTLLQAPCASGDFNCAQKSRSEAPRSGFVLPESETRALGQSNAPLRQDSVPVLPSSGDAAFNRHQRDVDAGLNGAPAAPAAPSQLDHLRGRLEPVRPAPPNTETATGGKNQANRDCAAEPTRAFPFRISIDGQSVDGSGRGPADSQRCVDMALAKADVQIRYDGMQTERRLNIVAIPDAVEKNTQAIFTTFTNYTFWLARAEVRIFGANQSGLGLPIVVAPVDRGIARVTIPSDAPREIRYLLRVYDSAGRFDETAPKLLKIADLASGRIQPGDALSVYEGNALAVKNIPVAGGTVTVSGRGLQPGTSVKVMGLNVPLDAKGDFVTRQILAPGKHDVEVSIADKKGIVSEFSRTATIPDNDYFYVAMADLTAGRTNASGNHALVRPENERQYDNKTVINGRTAFYFKGLIKGEYLLTAAADTQDQPLGSMFSNLDSKDPRYLLRSLDPNKYYPVYGDDSTLVWDAPTRGKFYVRLERGASSIVWGNFKTSINGTDLVRYDRGLYGAQAKVATDEATKFGERRAQAEVFAAKPGTTGARDVFRGTGGSLYYLRRQAITQGSERVTVETRDANTGLVLQSHTLAPTQDYDIDALQGRIMLRNPLSGAASQTLLIQGGTTGSYAEQYLVVTYEYAPDFAPTKDTAVGGRASGWLNDHVEVGATGYSQSMPGEKQQMGGADMTVRYKPGTYVKVEGARSAGPGSGEGASIDGGFTFDNRTSSGRPANAKKLEASVDLAEVDPNAKGRVSGFYKEREEGFSVPGQMALETAGREAGVIANARIDKDLSIKGKADLKDDQYRNYRSAEGNISRQMSDEWMFTTGAKIDQNAPRSASASPVLNQSGERLDVAARADYDSKRDWTTYGYVQGTARKTGDRDPNNRVGVGGSVRLTDKLTARGEISEGSRGIGAKLGTDYKVDERNTAYVNYALSPDRTDVLMNGGEGVLVTGGRTRFSDSASVYAEDRLRHGGGYGGLTHAYGLDFVPLQNWRMGIGAEFGELHDPMAGDINRVAMTGSVGYSKGGVTYSGKAEYRDDKTNSLVAGPGERKTYLARNTVGVKLNDSWRFIGKINASHSTGSLGTFYSGDYFEGVAAIAYRPVWDDRLNVLFKYTYFADTPTTGQLNLHGSASPFSQQSHVLSVDASYEILPGLTLGGKYAYRDGELRDNSLGGQWFNSTAHLLIGRVDVNLAKDWDALAEVRMLETPTAGSRQSGALVAIYRHINENAKIGAGYNFTKFSDDLTYLKYDRQGFFVNALAKY